MIIKTEPHAPVMAPAAADKVLPGLRFIFASGNACVVTPSMRRVEGGGGECRVNVSFAWQKEPSALDQAEVQAEVERLLGAKHEFMTGRQSGPQFKKVQEDWLLTGRVPE